MTDQAPPDAGQGATWAVVPFKGRRGGKRRLAPLLDERGRRLLGEAMLADVLAALTDCPAIERVLLVTPDPPVGTSLASLRVQVVAEPERATAAASGDDLNDALTHVQRMARGSGVGRLLIVPSDLPLLGSGDVQAILDAGASLDERVEGADGSIVVAPDGANTGTNALLLRPPDVLTPRFGRDSFEVHLAWAGERLVPSAIVRRPGLALDVDTPDDLARFLDLARDGSTLAALRTLGVDRRIAAPVRPGA